MKRSIDTTQDPIVYKMKMRDKMRMQLASIIGAVVAILSFFLIPVLCGLYQRLALSLGIWKEPDWMDITMLILTMPFVAGLLGSAVRWWLIFRWVGRN